MLAHPQPPTASPIPLGGVTLAMFPLITQGGGSSSSMRLSRARVTFRPHSSRPLLFIRMDRFYDTVQEAYVSFVEGLETGCVQPVGMKLPPCDKVILRETIQDEIIRIGFMSTAWWFKHLAGNLYAAKNCTFNDAVDNIQQLITMYFDKDPTTGMYTANRDAPVYWSYMVHTHAYIPGALTSAPAEALFQAANMAYADTTSKKAMDNSQGVDPLPYISTQPSVHDDDEEEVDIADYHMAMLSNKQFRDMVKEASRNRVKPSEFASTVINSAQALNHVEQILNSRKRPKPD